MSNTTKRCEAHITLKKGRMKEYGSNRSVYLKDGQEFEIELYNPHQKSVLAKIKMNGSFIAGGGIVLRPGQRYHLDRFLDNESKFKFNTYSVENTKEAAEAIALNGDVEVQFFYETEPPVYTQPNKWDQWNDFIKRSPYKDPYQPRTGDPYWYYDVYTTGTGSKSFNLNSQNLNDGNFNSTLIGGSGVVNCFYSNSMQTQNISASAEMANLTRSLSLDTEIETGRIEKGSKSDQKFIEVDMDFNSFYSESVSLKILPFSHKPVETADIRSYCPGCSARIKKTTWNFCPYCQADLRS